VSASYKDVRITSIIQLIHIAWDIKIPKLSAWLAVVILKEYIGANEKYIVAKIINTIVTIADKKPAISALKTTDNKPKRNGVVVNGNNGVKMKRAMTTTNGVPQAIASFTQYNFFFLNNRSVFK
jgi:hypothetical protein